jgi:hypothetical protein
MPDLFSPNGNQLKVDLGGSYDAGITEEIDKQIRHLPIVVNRAMESAATLKNSIGSPNFELVIQARSDTQRPRVYVVPKNNKGIHEELSQGVLLKAALGMAGK